MNLWNCFWSNWFWPVFALLLLGLLEMWPGGKWRSIEADVATRIEGVLAENNISEISVITRDRGRDVLLKGRVDSEEEKDQLVQLAQSVTDESGFHVARVVEWGGKVVKPESALEAVSDTEPKLQPQPETNPQAAPQPEPQPIVLANAQLMAKIEDGTITLDGVLSSQNQVDAVVASAYARFGASNVTSNLTVGDNIKPLAGLSGLFSGVEMSNGSVDIDGQVVRLSGEVASEEQKLQIGSAVSRAVGAEFAVDNTLVVVAPEIPQENLVCQTQLVELMNSSQVFFKTSSSVIKDASYPLLDKIVAILQQCPEANIEIAGHTDTTGNEEINLPLSQQRAQSVMAYITNQGIAAAALTAVGYGSSKPVATNATAEGRALNRRIEFTIK